MGGEIDAGHGTRHRRDPARRHECRTGARPVRTTMRAGLLSACGPQREEMHLRGSRRAKAGLFLGLPRSGPDAGCEKMRVRAPAAMIRRQSGRPTFRACENQYARPSIASGENASGLGCDDAGRCVDPQRLRGIAHAIADRLEFLRRPIPAQSVSGVRRRKGRHCENGAFRWNAGRYSSSAAKSRACSSSGLNRPARTICWSRQQRQRLSLLLARKLEEATYRLLPVSENNASKALQKRSCVKQDRDNCTIETRAQLDAFVHASIGKAGTLYHGGGDFRCNQLKHGLGGGSRFVPRLAPIRARPWPRKDARACAGSNDPRAKLPAPIFRVCPDEHG